MNTFNFYPQYFEVTTEEGNIQGIPRRYFAGAYVLGNQLEVDFDIYTRENQLSEAFPVNYAKDYHSTNDAGKFSIEQNDVVIVDGITISNDPVERFRAILNFY